MREYRIAYFTADWNFDLVESTLHGLKRYVEEHDNVRLCVFDCFGKDQGNARDQKEYAIFDLPDLSQFDGLLIQGNQIVLDPIRDVIAEKVAQSGIPAVSIDCPIEGCAMVGIDNEAAQFDIASHVIHEHGARRLVYLTGILNNSSHEGRRRLQGFKRACREAGIAPEDAEIIECTWRARDGAKTAQRWMRDELPLPDAFICANDEMALGLMGVLDHHGVQIPRDVIVTGFDNIASAEVSIPRLSTVHREYSDMNYSALGYLIAKIEGRESRSFIPFGYHVILSESCGCRDAASIDYFREQFFRQTTVVKNFFTLQNQMAEELFNANSLAELMLIVQRYYAIFGCENVYVCVNDRYFDNYDRKQLQPNSGPFAESMVLSACGGRDSVARRDLLYTRFPTQKLLPDALMEQQRFLVFYPLHYGAFSIGYVAMDGISPAAKLNLHESIFNFLEVAIENVRKKRLVGQLNEALEDLYIHDALTGLYNRFGFDRLGQQYYDGFIESDGGAQVLFVDMDNMKHINDRFGHDIGDAAIRVTARILQSACASRDFLMRYGGDEFLIIASRREDGIVHALTRAVEDYDYSNELPCRLDLSIGVVPSDAAPTLAECVREADVRMYDSKRRKKSGAE